MEKKLQVKLTVRLYTDEKFFGPGVATLLSRVAEHHSLRAAALSMDMAYSKASKIIKASEEVFGHKLLNSTTGGKHGGGACLTPEAEQLLVAYRAYCDDLNAYGAQLFSEKFAALCTGDGSSADFDMTEDI